jgi:hypothetical protein
MKYLKWLIKMCIVACFLVSCGQLVLPFHYIKSGEYSPVALRVIHIWIDKEFYAADQLALDDAIRQWNFALNGYVKLEIVSTTFDMEPEIIQRANLERGWLIMKVHSGNSIIPDQSDKGQVKYYTLAWVNDIGGNHMWMVRDRLKNEWMTGVALHEIGHMLGALHDNVYLMQPHFNWEDYRCVDYATLKQVADYQHIPMGSLNYCQYGSDVKFN